MLASLLTLAISPEVHLQKLWSVRVPGMGSVMPSSVRLSRSGNQIAWVAVEADKVQGTYWFDMPNQRFRVLSQTSPDNVQLDLGRNVISFTVENVTRTFDLQTGLFETTTPTITIRIRGLTTPIKRRGVSIYDASTKSYLYPEPGKIPSQLGGLIWDTPGRRLSIFRKDEQSDFKEIVEWVPGTFKEIGRAPVSYYVEGLDHIVGDPETGPFATYYSSNRDPRLTGVFGPKLKLIECPTMIESPLIDVFDISDRGILGGTGTVSEAGGMHNLTSLVCLDPVTGKIRWRNKRNLGGKWIGENVLSGDVILSGRTGTQIGKLVLPKGRVPLIWNGATLYCASPENQLTAYGVAP